MDDIARTADRALAATLTAVEDGALLDLEDLVRVTGAPRVLVEAAEREGLLIPLVVEAGASRFTMEDAEALRAGLRLLDAGLPLAELIELGHQADEALTGIANAAVEAFERFIRDPAVGDPDADAGTKRLVDAYTTMLPSAVHVVAHRLRRRLVTAALARLATDAPDASAG